MVDSRTRGSRHTGLDYWWSARHHVVRLFTEMYLYDIGLFHGDLYPVGWGAVFLFSCERVGAILHPAVINGKGQPGNRIITLTCH